jgi:hypothetical protein
MKKYTGDLFQRPDGSMAAIGPDITQEVANNPPADLNFVPGRDVIVKLSADVVLTQVACLLPPGADRETVQEVLRRHINWDLFRP